MPGMNKKFIRLDECDVLSKCVVGAPQMQALNHKCTEHSQESLVIRRPSTREMNAVITTLERPLSQNVGFHSEFPEQSQNLLKDMVQEKTDHIQTDGIHSEYKEPSRHSLDTMIVGRSRVQAASRVNPRHVPLTGIRTVFPRSTNIPCY